MKLMMVLLLGGIFSLSTKAQSISRPINSVSGAQLFWKLKSARLSEAKTTFSDGKLCRIYVGASPASDSYFVSIEDVAKHTSILFVQLRPQTRWFSGVTNFWDGKSYHFVENSGVRNRNHIILRTKNDGYFDLYISANGQEVTCNYRE